MKVSGAKGVMSHSLGNMMWAHYIVSQPRQYDVGTLYIEQKDAARSDERDCKYHPNHAPTSFCSLFKQFFWKD